VEWLKYLLLLICPLMMISCMKGHSHGRGHVEKSDIHKHPYTPISKNLDKKMSKLKIENKKLRNETDKLSATVKKES
jgi:hypothetical protein